LLNIDHENALPIYGIDEKDIKRKGKVSKYIYLLMDKT